MSGRKVSQRATIWLIVPLLICVCSVGTRAAQTKSIYEKLETLTDFVPKTTDPLNQLIEVAQRFKIPMGIEWIENQEKRSDEKAAAKRSRRVVELIEDVLSPGYQLEVDDGLLHIYSADEAVHAFNFLNIGLNEYSINDGDLFAAEDQLRWAIRFTLEPEKYRNGYNGGYGHGDNDIFEIPKFTLSGSQLTIREVLNRITLAQGNALWVATLNNEDFKGAKPFWRKKRAEAEPLPVTSRWHFYPLAGINELATEQVVVELLIDGHMDQRMSVIPVMSEYGLRGSEGGGGGGGSSDGFSYGYGASIEKLEKDSVTLSVHLSVQQPGEAELKFDESILVRRGRVLELHPAPRVRIKAYFEARNKTLD